MTATTLTLRQKEGFFREVLVPTGQVLEVLLALLQPHTSHRDFENLVHDAFDPLNLASYYAINPNNTELQELTKGVGIYVQGLMQIIDGLGPGRRPYLAAALGVRHRGASTKISAALRAASSQVRKVLPELVAPVLKAIGYENSIRSQWLADQSAESTPLTVGRRTNKWRTFVRNGGWHRAVELLDITSEVSNDLLVLNSFSSKVGVEAAALLWRETFSDKETSPAASSADGRLPAGVQVSSAPTGELRVGATFDPKQFLDARQVKAFRQDASAPAQALSTALALRQFQQVCDVATLATVVQNAAAWLQAQRDSREAVLAAYANWVDQQQVKAVREKLAAHFTKEERKLLVGLLASDTSKLTD